MKKITTTGIICVKDMCRILYKLAKIEYEEYENGEYVYKFYPFYNVIDFLPSSLFQGIPGLDLSLRRECYERRNMVPVFISERSPGENREDLQELLASCNMTSLNRLEWLIRTDMQYSGDNMFVIRFEETKTLRTNSMFDLVKRRDNIERTLLNIICAGDYLYAKDLTIDNETRGLYYRLLMSIYEKKYVSRKNAQLKGIRKAKNENTYKGRKKIKISAISFIEVSDDYSKKKITAEKAAETLGVSKSTFLRRLKSENLGSL